MNTCQLRVAVVDATGGISEKTCGMPAPYPMRMTMESFGPPQGNTRFVAPFELTVHLCKEHRDYINQKTGVVIG